MEDYDDIESGISKKVKHVTGVLDNSTLEDVDMFNLEQIQVPSQTGSAVARGHADRQQ